jgi:hypothetical protein
MDPCRRFRTLVLQPLKISYLRFVMNRTWSRLRTSGDLGLKFQTPLRFLNPLILEGMPDELRGNLIYVGILGDPFLLTPLASLDHTDKGLCYRRSIST